MTPERLAELYERRARATYHMAVMGEPLFQSDRDISDLLDEVERLTRELAEARLTAEQAWDACDDLADRHERKAA